MPPSLIQKHVDATLQLSGRGVEVGRRTRVGRPAIRVGHGHARDDLFLQVAALVFEDQRFVACFPFGLWRYARVFLDNSLQLSLGRFSKKTRFLIEVGPQS